MSGVLLTGPDTSASALRRISARIAVLFGGHSAVVVAGFTVSVSKVLVIRGRCSCLSRFRDTS